MNPKSSESGEVLFIAAPAAGHVNPLLPLVLELERRGHGVTFATGAEQIAAAASTGARAVELPWFLDPTSLSREQFSTTTFVDFLDNLLESAAPHMNRLLDDARARRTKAVCFDAMVAPIAIALAERLRVPAISLIPSMAVNENLPLGELLPADFRPDNPALVRYATQLQTFVAEQGLSTPLLPMVVPPVPLTVVFVPSAFQIAAGTFDSTHLFAGPTVPNARRPAEDRRPLLLVSLGTAFNDRPEVFRTCAAALADTDWRVAMSIGRTSRDALGDLPGNVEVAATVPQTELLGKASAFVTHAGMNSIMESLALQVPLITLPQVPEQALNARRVAELGLGEVLDSATFSAELLRETVLRVAGDDRVRERLEWMAAEIADAGGAAVAADAVLALIGTTEGK